MSGSHETAGSEQRCGFVAVVGAPNAGKSTLVNALVGAKVSIVTQKAQTTRVPVRGIFIEGRSQVVLIDTPGLFAPKRRLDRAMVEAAWSGAADSDLVAVLIDAQNSLERSLQPIVERLSAIALPRWLICNKIDAVERPKLLKIAGEANALVPFERTFMISSLTGDGIPDLKAALAKAAPAGPWHYPEDELSDTPLRTLAAEITREKLFQRLHEEIPYGLSVVPTSWKDLKDGSTRIEQTILVSRPGHRQIVLGKGGRTIKEISMAARAEIAEVVEHPVHLFLFVKVQEKWADDPEHYRDMGLDYPKD